MLFEYEAEDGGEEVGDADDEGAVGRVDRALRLLEDQLGEERYRSLQSFQVQENASSAVLDYPDLTL